MRRRGYTSGSYFSQIIPMKKIFHIAGALGVALIVQSARAQSVDKPVFKEGDNWEYQYFDTWSNRMTSTFSKQVIGVSGDFG